MISIIMPCYNASKYVREAIDSVLAQTHIDFEFIIIDDCSTDDTWEIIQSYTDKRIKAYRNDENLKIVKTRNKGFKHATREYIAIFDSDDVCCPDRFERQLKHLQAHEKCVLVGSSLDIINEDSVITGRRSYPASATRKMMLRYNYIAQPSVMFRKSLLDEVGVYQSNGHDRARDYDLWMRMSEVGELHNLQQPVIKYRISSTQGKTTHLKQTIKSTLEIQRRYLFKKEYFNVIALSRHILLYTLLVIPNRMILYLFKKVMIHGR